MGRARMECSRTRLLFRFEKVSDDERNLVWLIFTRPEMRSLMIDWPVRAQEVRARFRVVS